MGNTTGRNQGGAGFVTPPGSGDEHSKGSRSIGSGGIAPPAAIPSYIAQALLGFGHGAPSVPYHAPSRYTPPKFGQRIQYATIDGTGIQDLHPNLTEKIAQMVPPPRGCQAKQK